MVAFVWPGLLRAQRQAAIVFQGADFRIFTMHDDGGDVRRFDVAFESRVGFPRFSPDGRFFAFIGAAEDGTEELYVSDADGSNPRAVAPSPGRSEGAPTWSPDSKTILFASQRDGNWEIYSVGRDGRGLLRLTNDPSFDGSPTFSPDGRSIAFSSDRGGGEDSHIFVMSLDGTGVRPLTAGEDESAPDYSPDGRLIAFVGFTGGNADIWIAGSDGADPRRITTGEAFEYGPRWSFDGRLIAFERYLSQVPDIFLIRPDGSGLRRLTESIGYAGSPAWIPSTVRIR